MTHYEPEMARAEENVTRTKARTKATPPDPFHTQIGGTHYKGLRIQPTEYILANELPFVEGCVVKYVTRWKSKGGLEDLQKAKHYLEILIAHETANREQGRPAPDQ